MPVPSDKNKTSIFKHFDNKLDSWSDELGNLLVNIFHHLALFAIGAATVWASASAFIGMVQHNESNVENLLLLFIYLEIGAMVGIYFKTNRMPVRFLIYVAITALTRLLISIANKHDPLDGEHLLLISGGILLLAFSALVLRYGSHHFPSNPETGQTEDDS